MFIYFIVEKKELYLKQESVEEAVLSIIMEKMEENYSTKTRELLLGIILEGTDNNELEIKNPEIMTNFILNTIKNLNISLALNYLKVSNKEIEEYLEGFIYTLKQGILKHKNQKNIIKDKYV